MTTPPTVRILMSHECGAQNQTVPSVATPPELPGEVFTAPASPAAYLFGAFGILLTGLAVWATLRITRRAKNPEPQDPAVRALQRLERLQAGDGSDSRREAIELSSLLRDYTDERLGIAAPRMTTAQLRNETVLDDADGRHLTDALDQCDRVKFAGETLAPKERATCHGDAEVFIRAKLPSASANEA